jgi:hypothetical protein
MAHGRINVDKLPAGPELNALVAERVMGWKDLERQSDRFWGRKRDRAGRWRRTAVHDFCHEPTTSYEVEERMKELGLVAEYERELAKLTKGKNLPAAWAAPEQRCRAALKVMNGRRAAGKQTR